MNLNSDNFDSNRRMTMHFSFIKQYWRQNRINFLLFMILGWLEVCSFSKISVASDVGNCANIFIN